MIFSQSFELNLKQLEDYFKQHDLNQPKEFMYRNLNEVNDQIFTQDNVI